MLKTEAYLAIFTTDRLIKLQRMRSNGQAFKPGKQEGERKQTKAMKIYFRPAQLVFVLFVVFCFPANSNARLIAATMLSGRAIPLPAISNAVPWSGLWRGKGRPSVTFTPL